MNRIYL